MLTSVQAALVALLVSQVADPPSWIWAVVVLAVAALAIAAWAIPKNRLLTRELGSLRAESDALKAEQRKVSERNRKQAKDLDQRSEEIKRLKQDLAGQRKKTHTAQEDAKRLRKDLRDHQRAREKARDSRPAFESKPKAEPPPEEKKERQTEEPKKPVKGVTLGELQDRVASLVAAKEKLEHQLETQRSTADDSKSTLRQLRRRLEDLRRVDIISKGKVEALEDRLKHLGRQYYDVVTEVAVLKGEVPAPGMRPAAPPEEPDHAHADREDEESPDAPDQEAESRDEPEPEPEPQPAPQPALSDEPEAEDTGPDESAVALSSDDAGHHENAGDHEGSEAASQSPQETTDGETGDDGPDAKKAAAAAV